MADAAGLGRHARYGRPGGALRVRGRGAKHSRVHDASRQWGFRMLSLECQRHSQPRRHRGVHEDRFTSRGAPRKAARGRPVCVLGYDRDE